MFKQSRANPFIVLVLMSFMLFVNPLKSMEIVLCKMQEEPGPVYFLCRIFSFPEAAIPMLPICD